MAWLNRNEKREYVVRLLKEKKNLRLIAQLAHMSIRDICVIKKELEVEVEGNTSDHTGTKLKSKESQAFDMFLQNKRPVEVVRDLDLEAGVVRAMYLDYLELSGMSGLTTIYKEIKGDLRPFLNFFNLAKSQGMGKEEIMNGLKLANNYELPHLLEQVDYLRNQKTILELQIAKRTNYLVILNRRIDEFKGISDTYIMSVDEKREELAYLNQELIRSSNFAKSREDTADGSWLYHQKSE